MLRRFLGYAWASPNTVLGLTFGIALLLFGGQVQIRRGAVEFSGGLIGAGFAAMRPGFRFQAITLGHAILGIDRAALAASRSHEQVHVRQYERWGPLFLPAYVLSGAWQLLRGRHAYHDNPFEREACARAECPPVIRRLQSSDPRVQDGLCTLLIDAVEDGASVGFLAPITRETARRYWAPVLDALDDGMVLWIAEADGEVVGTVQLSLSLKQNSPHRAEVQKLLVRRSHRGRGISTALMQAVEDWSAANGRTLLILDTIAGSPAEFVYRHLGWQKVGEIPDYAAMPDGELRPTAYYYKRVPARAQ